MSCLTISQGDKPEGARGGGRVGGARGRGWGEGVPGWGGWGGDYIRDLNVSTEADDTILGWKAVPLTDRAVETRTACGKLSCRREAGRKEAGCDWVGIVLEGGLEIGLLVVLMTTTSP